MSRVVGALLTVIVMASSVRADVIPSRRPDQGTTEERRQVSERLQAIGIQKEQAVAQANDLTDREARYFGQNPDRIQRAGDEGEFAVVAALIEGGLLLGLVAGGIIWRANVAN